MNIYLASKSPRRKELLELMEVSFEVLSINTPEIVKPNETPEAYSQRITQEKLQAAWKKIIDERLKPLPVLCADTEVILDNKILGKPQDEEEAFIMLRQCSGKTHQVITSVGLLHEHYEKIRLNTTYVTFAEMTDEAIQHYLKSGNYKDKSGSYGIQSYIGQFISRIDGCFYSVMGLPLNTVREILNDFNAKKSSLQNN
ncbi:MAG: septum formation protein Maf [Legionella longbeachae]|nr:septum formation protein Maf [Legionella longbeachae]